MVYIKYKKLKYIVLVLGIVVIIGFNLYRSYHGIQISKYHLASDKITSSMKLAIISDLHNHIFGKKNEEIFEKINQQQPDLILIVGDMLNQDSEETQLVTDLIRELKRIVPVYYALGNHEIEWINSHGENLKKKLEDAGAIVLNEAWCEIELNGQEIRLGGLYNYAFDYETIDFNSASEDEKNICEFLDEFQDTEDFKIMLSHRPESFVCSSAIGNCDIDLIVCGHLHGGQVVLPLLGGIYGADQGWFPKYVHGLYQKDNINIIITSGLSTNKKILPRWNNPPEIVILELTPENNK